jgi:hypothetical protein
VSLTLVPITLAEANEFVRLHHRHHQPVPGCKFCLAVSDGEKIVGVAIVGRPVARMLDDGWTLEVNRTCTDGTKNANSMLYGACQRVAFGLGLEGIPRQYPIHEGWATAQIGSPAWDGFMAAFHHGNPVIYEGREYIVVSINTRADEECKTVTDFLLREPVTKAVTTPNSNPSETYVGRGGFEPPTN